MSPGGLDPLDRDGGKRRRRPNRAYPCSCEVQPAGAGGVGHEGATKASATGGIDSGLPGPDLAVHYVHLHQAHCHEAPSVQAIGELKASWRGVTEWVRDCQPPSVGSVTRNRDGDSSRWWHSWPSTRLMLGDGAVGAPSHRFPSLHVSLRCQVMCAYATHLSSAGGIPARRPVSGSLISGSQQELEAGPPGPFAIC